MITLIIAVLAFVGGMLVGSNNVRRVKENSKRVEDALVRALDKIEELKKK